jgi:tetratricopeptide (TPR) repeat protein
VKGSTTLSTVFLLSVVAATALGQTPKQGNVAESLTLKARVELNQGVAAYRDGKYDQAIEFFKDAKDDDPTLVNARLYLATAYATEYIPGAPSDENIRMGQAAVKEFQDVLSVDPNNISAIDGIGSILFNMAGTPYTRSRFEESKTYHMKHIKLKPEDPEPYYWIGVIDWTLAYRSSLETRGAWRLAHPDRSLKDDDPLPPDVRINYVKENGRLIDEGITDLRKAIELRPDYDDAIAYLNLTFRRKADEAAGPDERASMLKQADELVDKAKEIKQRKMETPAATATETDATVITSMTSIEFQEVVQAMGFECTRGKDPKGKDDPFFTFRAEGYKVAAFTNDSSYLQLYNGFTDVSPTLAAVNQWNQTNSFSRAYVDKDGNAALESDMILTGGVTRDNIEMFVKTFRDSVARWARFALDHKK